MPPPEPTPVQSSLPAAAAHFGAHVLAEAAARARDIGAATGGPSPAPSAVAPEPPTPAAPTPPPVPAAAISAPPAPATPPVPAGVISAPPTPATPPVPAAATSAPPTPATPPVPAGVISAPTAPATPPVPAAATSAPPTPAPPPVTPTPAPATAATAATAPTVDVPPAAGADLERLLRGPSGIGTAGLSLRPRAEPAPPAASADPVTAAAPQGRPIPGLYHHVVPDPDPVRVEEVSRRIKAWALDEVSLYPDDWEEEFDGFSVGSYMVGCHPDAPTVDHVMIATRLMVAENAVDDCYCEDHGGSPVGLGERLLLAHTALDPLHTTPEYQADWEKSLRSDAPRRAYRSAMEYFVQASSPSQADRYRHDMARLHMGYLAEAAWAQLDEVPEVWEYLAMRQFNNFRPCPTITDTVGGYELPADLHARPQMQKVIALAGNATTIVNDLYSYTKELDAPGTHLNLPVVLAAREDLCDRDAYLKAVEVHNDLMHAFEAEAAALAADCPLPGVQRFLRGVAAWVDGNHHWHQTNTYRYSLPDFW